MSFEATHSAALQGRDREARTIQKMCTGKERFANKRAIQTFLNSFKKNRGRHGRPEWLRGYPCPICNGWHLTKGKPQ